ncbi:MAG: RNA polymerase factor sigma-54 [Alphaproteobacteria bacterium]|nr:RNA polymerase factor sigma-54 [Alphaproteobacteria bacterium]
MNVTQRLDIRQSQSLVMTPQLQQAIKLLQMSNLELGAFVAAELDSNPLLERAEGEGDDFPVAEDVPVVSESAAAGELTGDLPVQEYTDSGKEYNADDAWADGVAHNAADGAASSLGQIQGHGQQFSDGETSFEQTVAAAVSLREHLLSQVHVDLYEPDERMIGSALIEMLDEAGYLPPDLDLVRSQMGATEAQFASVIEKLQSFDPPGIFARSLQECLALQLREKNRLDPAMEALLANLGLLAKNDKAQLMKLCGVDAADLADMVTEIRALNPKPATAFVNDVAQPVVPDVILRAVPGGGWHIELNTETLPRVLANERYYNQVSGSSLKAGDKSYISERWQQANWLVKALHQRATTILKVASEIVRQQDKFFVYGVAQLKPLILRDVAAAIEMHESTVSRVTSNKFIATPRGIFELKYFFSTAVGGSEGGESVAAEAVRHRIKTLIEAERPDDILSDDRIAAMLKQEGISVARRTVAKYRENMHLGSSAERRRQKAS